MIQKIDIEREYAIVLAKLVLSRAYNNLLSPSNLPLEKLAEEYVAYFIDEEKYEEALNLCRLFELNFKEVFVGMTKRYLQILRLQG